MPDSILLIDDDERLGAMLKSYLGDAGYALSCSTTGAQAMALAEGGGSAIRSVLCYMGRNIPIRSPDDDPADDE